MLEANEADRRDLLANVGHEIRTPVAALRAQLENLVDGVRPVDRGALEEVLGQALRLNDLVEDLLDLARAEGGGKPLRTAEVELRPLVDEAAREISAARPGTVIHADVEPGLVAVADPRRLRQVLVNLLDNAARHASSGAVVSILSTIASNSAFWKRKELRSGSDTASPSGLKYLLWKSSRLSAVSPAQKELMLSS